MTETRCNALLSKNPKKSFNVRFEPFLRTCRRVSGLCTWRNLPKTPKIWPMSSPRAPNDGPANARPASIPAGKRVYAIGDVHGRLDLLDQLLAHIQKDAQKFTGEKVLVMLGDLVDRGPNSKGVLERFAKPASNGFKTVLIKGNHEAMMLDFIDGLDDSYDWLSNGGMETLSSFGIDPWHRDIDELRIEFKSKLKPAHLEVLKSMRQKHRIGDYLFVHAGIRPDVALKDQDPDDLMWIRRTFLDHKGDFGFTVVHGHSVREKPEIRTNRIGIDTGAWMSERLSALVLDGTDQRFLHT